MVTTGVDHSGFDRSLMILENEHARAEDKIQACMELEGYFSQVRKNKNETLLTAFKTHGEKLIKALLHCLENENSQLRISVLSVLKPAVQLLPKSLGAGMQIAERCYNVLLKTSQANEENTDPSCKNQILVELFRCMSKFDDPQFLDAMVTNNVGYSEHKVLIEKCVTCEDCNDINNKKEDSDSWIQNLKLEAVRFTARLIKVCGSLLCNQFKDDFDFWLELLIQALLVFCEEYSSPSRKECDTDIRKAAREAVEALIVLVPKDEQIKVERWPQIKRDIKDRYAAKMVTLVGLASDWAPTWCLFLDILDMELIRKGNNQIINKLLNVEEKAFKYDRSEVRVQAFICWRHLISKFLPANVEVANDVVERSVRLLVQPLQSNNAKIDIISQQKLNTWWHLVRCLEKCIEKHLEDVLTPFLVYCFGNPKTRELQPGKRFASLHIPCAQALSYILDHEPEKHHSATQKPKKIDNTECIILPSTIPLLRKPSTFLKVSEELLYSVGECIVIQCSKSDIVISSQLLSTIWNYLLRHISVVLGSSEIAPERMAKLVQDLLKMIQNLAERSSCAAPALAANCINLVLEGVVMSPHALPPAVLASSANYVGTSQLMTGTPALFLIEIMVSRPLLQLATSHPRYIPVLKTILQIGISHHKVLEFMHSVMKQLETVASAYYNVNSVERSSLCIVWSNVATVLTNYLKDHNDVNQGNEKHHDLSCFYLVVVFPFHHMYSITYKQTVDTLKVWVELYKSFHNVAIRSIQTLEINEVCEAVALKITQTLVKHCPTSAVQAISLLKAVQNMIMLIPFSEICGTRQSSKTKSKFVLLPDRGRTSKPTNYITNTMNLVVKIAQLFPTFERSGEWYNTAGTLIMSCLETLFKNMKSASVAAAVPMVSTLSDSVLSLLQATPLQDGTIQFWNESLQRMWKCYFTFIETYLPQKSVKDFLGWMSGLLEAGFKHPQEEIRCTAATFWDKIIIPAFAMDNTSVPQALKEARAKCQIPSTSSKSGNSTDTNCKQSDEKEKVVEKEKMIEPVDKTVFALPEDLSKTAARHSLVKQLQEDGHVLTKHQKEVFRRRKDDIPAMYSSTLQPPQEDSMMSEGSQDVIDFSVPQRVMEPVRSNTNVAGPVFASSLKVLEQPSSLRRLADYRKKMMIDDEGSIVLASITGNNSIINADLPEQPVLTESANDGDETQMQAETNPQNAPLSFTFVSDPCEPAPPASNGRKLINLEYVAVRIASSTAETSKETPSLPDSQLTPEQSAAAKLEKAIRVSISTPAPTTIANVIDAPVSFPLTEQTVCNGVIMASGDTITESQNILAPSMEVQEIVELPSTPVTILADKDISSKDVTLISKSAGIASSRKLPQVETSNKKNSPSSLQRTDHSNKLAKRKPVVVNTGSPLTNYFKPVSITLTADDDEVVDSRNGSARTIHLSIETSDSSVSTTTAVSESKSNISGMNKIVEVPSGGFQHGAPRDTEVTEDNSAHVEVSVSSVEVSTTTKEGLSEEEIPDDQVSLSPVKVVVEKVEDYSLTKTFAALETMTPSSFNVECDKESPNEVSSSSRRKGKIPLKRNPGDPKVPPFKGTSKTVESTQKKEGVKEVVIKCEFPKSGRKQSKENKQKENESKTSKRASRSRSGRKSDKEKLKEADNNKAVPDEKSDINIATDDSASPSLLPSTSGRASRSKTRQSRSKKGSENVRVLQQNEKSSNFEFTETPETVKVKNRKSSKSPKVVSKIDPNPVTVNINDTSIVTDTPIDTIFTKSGDIDNAEQLTAVKTTELYEINESNTVVGIVSETIKQDTVNHHSCPQENYVELTGNVIMDTTSSMNTEALSCDMQMENMLCVATSVEVGTVGEEVQDCNVSKVEDASPKKSAKVQDCNVGKVENVSPKKSSKVQDCNVNKVENASPKKSPKVQDCNVGKVENASPKKSMKVQDYNIGKVEDASPKRSPKVQDCNVGKVESASPKKSPKVQDCSIDKVEDASPKKSPTSVAKSIFPKVRLVNYSPVKSVPHGDSKLKSSGTGSWLSQSRKSTSRLSSSAVLQIRGDDKSVPQGDSKLISSSTDSGSSQSRKSTSRLSSSAVLQIGGDNKLVPQAESKLKSSSTVSGSSQSRKSTSKLSNSAVLEIRGDDKSVPQVDSKLKSSSTDSGSSQSRKSTSKQSSSAVLEIGGDHKSVPQDESKLKSSSTVSGSSQNRKSTSKLSSSAVLEIGGDHKSVPQDENKLKSSSTVSGLSQNRKSTSKLSSSAVLEIGGDDKSVPQDESKLKSSSTGSGSSQNRKSTSILSSSAVLGNEGENKLVLQDQSKLKSSSTGSGSSQNTKSTSILSSSAVLENEGENKSVPQDESKLKSSSIGSGSSQNKKSTSIASSSAVLENEEDKPSDISNAGGTSEMPPDSVATKAEASELQVEVESNKRKKGSDPNDDGNYLEDITPRKRKRKLHQTMYENESETSVMITPRARSSRLLAGNASASKLYGKLKALKEDTSARKSLKANVSRPEMLLATVTLTETTDMPDMIVQEEHTPHVDVNVEKETVSQNTLSEQHENVTSEKDVSTAPNSHIIDQPQEDTASVENRIVNEATTTKRRSRLPAVVEKLQSTSLTRKLRSSVGKLSGILLPDMKNKSVQQEPDLKIQSDKDHSKPSGTSEGMDTCQNSEDKGMKVIDNISLSQNEKPHENTVIEVELETSIKSTEQETKEVPLDEIQNSNSNLLADSEDIIESSQETTISSVIVHKYPLTQKCSVSVRKIDILLEPGATVKVSSGDEKVMVRVPEDFLSPYKLCAASKEELHKQSDKSQVDTDKVLFATRNLYSKTSDPVGNDVNETIKCSSTADESAKENVSCSEKDRQITEDNLKSEFASLIGLQAERSTYTSRSKSKLTADTLKSKDNVLPVVTDVALKQRSKHSTSSNTEISTIDDNLPKHRTRKSSLSKHDDCKQSDHKETIKAVTEDNSKSRQKQPIQSEAEQIVSVVIDKTDASKSNFSHQSSHSKSDSSNSTIKQSDVSKPDSIIANPLKSKSIPQVIIRDIEENRTNVKENHSKYQSAEEILPLKSENVVTVSKGNTPKLRSKQNVNLPKSSDNIVTVPKEVTQKSGSKQLSSTEETIKEEIQKPRSKSSIEYAIEAEIKEIVEKTRSKPYINLSKSESNIIPSFKEETSRTRSKHQPVATKFDNNVVDTNETTIRTRSKQEMNVSKAEENILKEERSRFRLRPQPVTSKLDDNSAADMKETVVKTRSRQEMNMSKAGESIMKEESSRSRLTLQPVISKLDDNSAADIKETVVKTRSRQEINMSKAEESIMTEESSRSRLKLQPVISKLDDNSATDIKETVVKTRSRQEINMSKAEESIMKKENSRSRLKLQPVISKLDNNSATDIKETVRKSLSKEEMNMSKAEESIMKEESSRSPLKHQPVISKLDDNHAANIKETIGKSRSRQEMNMSKTEESIVKEGSSRSSHKHQPVMSKLDNSTANIKETIGKSRSRQETNMSKTEESIVIEESSKSRLKHQPVISTLDNNARDIKETVSKSRPRQETNMSMAEESIMEKESSRSQLTHQPVISKLDDNSTTNIKETIAKSRSKQEMNMSKAEESVEKEEISRSPFKLQPIISKLDISATDIKQTAVKSRPKEETNMPKLERSIETSANKDTEKIQSKCVSLSKSDDNIEASPKKEIPKLRSKRVSLSKYKGNMATKEISPKQQSKFFTMLSSLSKSEDSILTAVNDDSRLQSKEVVALSKSEDNILIADKGNAMKLKPKQHSNKSKSESKSDNVTDTPKPKSRQQVNVSEVKSCVGDDSVVSQIKMQDVPWADNTFSSDSVNTLEPEISFSVLLSDDNDVPVAKDDGSKLKSKQKLDSSKSDKDDFSKMKSKSPPMTRRTKIDFREPGSQLLSHAERELKDSSKINKNKSGEESKEKFQDGVSANAGSNIKRVSSPEKDNYKSDGLNIKGSIRSATPHSRKRNVASSISPEDFLEPPVLTQESSLDMVVAKIKRLSQSAEHNKSLHETSLDSTPPKLKKCIDTSSDSDKTPSPKSPKLSSDGDKTPSPTSPKALLCSPSSLLKAFSSPSGSLESGQNRKSQNRRPTGGRAQYMVGLAVAAKDMSGQQATSQATSLVPPQRPEELKSIIAATPPSLPLPLSRKKLLYDLTDDTPSSIEKLQDSIAECDSPLPTYSVSLAEMPAKRTLKEYSRELDIPPYKKKRVSFSVPEVSGTRVFSAHETVEDSGNSVRKTLSPGNRMQIGMKKRDRKTLKTAKFRAARNSPLRMSPVASPASSLSSPMLPPSTKDVLLHSQSSPDLTDLISQGSVDEPITELMNTQDAFFPPLVNCNHPIECVAPRLTTHVMWTKALVVELTRKNIRTVGDLSRLDEASINRLPIANPKITHAKTVLQDYMMSLQMESPVSPKAGGGKSEGSPREPESPTVSTDSSRMTVSDVVKFLASNKDSIMTVVNEVKKLPQGSDTIKQLYSVLQEPRLVVKHKPEEFFKALSENPSLGEKFMMNYIMSQMTLNHNDSDLDSSMMNAMQTLVILRKPTKELLQKMPVESVMQYATSRLSVIDKIGLCVDSLSADNSMEVSLNHYQKLMQAVASRLSQVEFTQLVYKVTMDYLNSK
ncbi:serine-rich adhesin for platelets-like [Periplaneta americana]|uniref:serine-rich adhesin for platelets-like n=1 Tax=Periplaneta americana TaxID=6978 RepID=UPI0037E86F7A